MVPAPRTVDVGSVVVCTGYKEFDAARAANFGYGRLPNVITSFEFEQMLKEREDSDQGGKIPQYVALIHCVGNRNKEFHSYCSRVCCMTGLKFGHEIKSALPESYIYDLYIDMHAFGKGLRGLLPAQFRDEDHVSDVRQRGQAGDPGRRPG